MTSMIRRAGVAVALVGATALGTAGAAWLPAAADSTQEVESAARMANPPVDTTAGGLSAAFRTAARRALPAVVHIRVESTRAVAAQRLPEGLEGTPFERFFRQGEPQPQAPRTGSGSGFIFSQDGYILTNNHVVDNATRVTVILPDKREFEATVVGRDPNTDLAVVKVDAKGLPVLRLGDSDALEVGDWVVALGFPLQLGSTVTAGIVSAKGKSIGIIGRDDQASAPLEHFIQTDAAINPGNSGGPLVDLQGRVVGINSAIASPTGYYSGYGFAVPVSLAQRIASDLIEHGEVRRPKLGVGIRDPSLADAEAAGLSRPLGALVASVEPGSPAERAGLELNDAIVAVEGRTVETAGDLMELIARHEPGESVRLTVVRGGKQRTVAVALDASFAPSVRASENGGEKKGEGVMRLGFEAAPLTAQLAQQLGIRAERGLAVTRVNPASPAGRAGLRAGMLLESLNGRRLQSRDDLEAAVRSLGDKELVTMIVGVPAEGGSLSRTVINFRIGG